MEYITEAEALRDIYDDFESYADIENRTNKSKFKACEKGKYAVVQTPRYNRDLIDILYLVDRNKTKQIWWSSNSNYAILFNSKKAAEKTASKYKYNNVHVIKIK